MYIISLAWKSCSLWLLTPPMLLPVRLSTILYSFSNEEIRKVKYKYTKINAKNKFHHALCSCSVFIFNYKMNFIWQNINFENYELNSEMEKLTSNLKYWFKIITSEFKIEKKYNKKVRGFVIDNDPQIPPLREKRRW